jgi:hypothetical protein
MTCLCICVQSRTLNNFDVDLSDGIVLFAVLLNHWPPLARHKGRLHQFPADPRQIRENAELVVGCMQVGGAGTLPPAPDPAAMCLQLPAAVEGVA